MEICPKCRKEIYGLVCWSSGEMKEIWTESDKSLCFEEVEFVADGRWIDFECPMCDAVLFHTSEEAEAFLKGAKDN